MCREAVTSLIKFSKWNHRLALDLLGISEENIGLAIEMAEAMRVCLQDDSLRLTCKHLRIVIHEDSVQVSSQLFQYIQAFIIR